MKRILLLDERGVDGVAFLENISAAKRRAPPPIIAATDDEAHAVRLIKHDSTRDFAALAAAHGDALPQALLDGDPEIDFDNAGRPTGRCERVWLGDDGAVEYAPEYFEIRLGPDGEEIARRPWRPRFSNIGERSPLVVRPHFLPAKEIARRYIFRRHCCLVHADGVGFDFLRRLAKTLAQKNAMAAVGAGANGKKPLILERNGKACRGFLEGRVRGDSYLLLLRLSDCALKAPRHAA